MTRRFDFLVETADGTLLNVGPRSRAYMEIMVMRDFLWRPVVLSPIIYVRIHGTSHETPRFYPSKYKR